MNYFAQAAPDFPFFREVILTIVYCLGVVVLVLAGLVHAKKLREQPAEKPPEPKAIPQPLIHQRHPEWVPRHEFTDLKTQVAHVEARVDRVHKDLLDAGEQRAVKIHERLNLLIEPLAEIRGRVNALTDFMKEQKQQEPSKRPGR